jgi:hypothetical protein
MSRGNDKDESEMSKKKEKKERKACVYISISEVS